MELSLSRPVYMFMKKKIPITLKLTLRRKQPTSVSLSSIKVSEANILKPAIAATHWSDPVIRPDSVHYPNGVQ